MKKSKLRIMLSFLVASAIIMTSCSKKMDPLSANLFSANPSPLEQVGPKVPVTISGSIPADWFLKDAVVTVTPVLKYAGKEALGASQTYQGENVAGNGIVINQKSGGTVTMNTSYNYVDEMRDSELFLRFVAKKGNKDLQFPDMKIADGVMATGSLASAYSTNPSYASDAFQRVMKESHDANILFLIQRAELRSTELNKTSIDTWKNLVKEASENDRKKLDLEISAYASPDGGYKLNEKLAEQREKNTTQYLEKELKRQNIDTDVNAHYTAQDWEGFKKLVQASNLQDKNLVLSVLSMYNNPEEREREIKNISTVYSELADNILPMLRRSRLIANVEIIGKSDAELVEASKKANTDLSAEELLYAATLKGVDMQKVYTEFTKKYPNDYRGWNNLGAQQFKKGDYAGAKKSLNEAKRLSTRAVESNMNLALLEMADGNTSAAEQLLGSASGASNLNEAMGLMHLQKGDYQRAESSFGDVKSNNAAIAQILTKNYNKAQRTLDAVPTKDGMTSYLLAIVAARTNNANDVAKNLEEAHSKGISTTQIATDREFARFWDNSAIQNLLRKY